MSVYFYGCMTMDGYLADQNHGWDWLYQTGSTEETDYDHFYASMDITIMGRRTYEEIAKAGNVATIYPTTQNYVFTHQQLQSEPGIIPVRGDVSEFVKHLGQNKNIWVIGGTTVLSPLLDQNMVDFIALQIAPVLLGNGIPLFSQKEALKRFTLNEVKQYNQFAELIYAKAI